MGKYIWTNGCFDLFHPGHLRLLEYSRGLGDYLTVGLDTDEKIRRDKGNIRPIYKLEDRRKLLESLRFVDRVVVFDSNDELICCIQEYKPDIIVVGEEYRNRVVGGEYAREIIYFPKVNDYSTTNLIKGWNFNETSYRT